MDAQHGHLHAPSSERKVVARLAEKAQALHTQRRAGVEQFLYDLGTSPAQSPEGSRNPLLKPDEFARRVKKIDPKGPLARDLSGLYAAARDETAALTEQIAQVERDAQRISGSLGRMG